MGHPFLIAVAAIIFIFAIGAGTSAEAQSHEEEDYGHEIGVVLGGSYVTQSEENFFTLGGDYEFRFHRRLGVGACFEYATRADAEIVSFPVLVHLSGLGVFAGPGFEVTPRETGGSGREEHAETEGGTRFLLRVGGQYAITLRGRWRLSPFVALDLVNEHEHVGKVVVYGVKLSLEL